MKRKSLELFQNKKIRSQHYEQKIKIKKTLLQKTLETKNLIFRKGSNLETKFWKRKILERNFFLTVWRENLKEQKF